LVRFTVCLSIALALALPAGANDKSASAPPAEPRVLELDRVWDVLPAPRKKVSVRATLKAAAAALGDKQVELAGVLVDGPMLARIAERARKEPLTRVAREEMRRPVDVRDLCYFLDDVLKAKAHDTGPVVLTPGRARRIGVFLHPDDVFRRRARRYGQRYKLVPIDPVGDPVAYEPPPDGSVLGPAWYARYPNPEEEPDMIAALKQARPQSDFDARVQSLILQLRAQGAEVFVESTLRHRERGYLMWGAFWLSRADDQAQLDERRATLDQLNGKWGLNVPIAWQHQAGWETTKDQARQMAEAYDVVFATRHGAQKSNHYEGRAIDLVALGLPRKLTLNAPNGRKRTFDLSRPNEARDLSLSPALVSWIEKNFGFKKLKGDYPHWDDAKR
jgi:hypothetical protein